MNVKDRDRREWAFHPVTQEFLAGLRESKQESLELWAREGYTQSTPEGTLQANAKALGGVSVLDQTIDLIEGYKELDDTAGVEMVAV